MKTARLALSLFFFTAYLLVFSGILNGIVWLIDFLTEMQFFPAILKMIGGSTAAAAGFGFILIFTFVCGRFYCSTLCPLGAVQDLFLFTGRKIFKKGVFRFHKTQNLLRYGLLGSSAILFFAGNLVLINMLEPFSNFGRAAANLARPLASYFFNNLSVILSSHHIYIIPNITLNRIEGSIVILSASFFLILLLLSIFRGRFYCNTFCPTGSLLSLFSRFSILRLSIKKEDCSGCALCERSCKAECIDSRNMALDYSRCINCYDCLEACPQHAIEFQYRYTPWKKEKKMDGTKREFLTLLMKGFTAAIFLSLLGNRSLAAVFNSIVPLKRKYPVIPPGGLSIEHFAGNCTACHLCVSACPAKVIKPALAQFGISGIFQPVMDYDTSFCNYECNACLYVCPTGALKERSLDEKKLIQIGFANLIKENCIVYTQDKKCGICAEYCPTKAVFLVPYKKDLPGPETDREICIGCGACEFACPARPYKAIFVEGNPVHKRAKKNENKPAEIKKTGPQDFPF